MERVASAVDVREHEVFGAVEWQHPGDFGEFIHLLTFRTDDGAPVLLMRILDTAITDDLWAVTLKNVKLFFRFAEANGVRFHFVFDAHDCDMLPTTRLLDMYHFLQKRRAVLATTLHSTAIVTNTRLVETLLRNVLGLVKTVRPLMIFYADRAPPLGAASRGPAEVSDDG